MLTSLLWMLQAQLVYECGQIKGSIAMTHPDRIHSGKVGDDRAHHLCVSNTADSKDVTRLLEMVNLSKVCVGF